MTLYDEANRASSGFDTTATASPTFLGLTKPSFFTLVFVLLVCNAMLPTIVIAVNSYGAVDSMINTFEISAVVWGGIAIGIGFSWAIEPSAFSRLEKLLLLCALVASFLPLGNITWAVVSLFGLLTVLAAGSVTKPQGRAGWVFFAITIPMFWSKQLFNMFSEALLSFDAVLVSGITQTERTGNIVAMPGGQGFLEIHPLCSSVSNLSTAILCWMLLNQVFGGRFHPRNLMWCLLACVPVIGINMVRIALIGYFPQHYDLLHGPLGRAVASWTTIFFVILICMVGVRREQERSV
jgi:exosortase/archaeosortase family protein